MQTPNRGKTRTPRGSADLWSEPLYLSVGATFLTAPPSSVAPGPQPSTKGDLDATCEEQYLALVDV